MIVDFDALAATLGATVPHAPSPAVKAAAHAARSAVIDQLIDGPYDDTGWIIHSSPSNEAVERYSAAGVEFVILDPGKDECLDRAESDGRPQETLDWIASWYESPPEIASGSTANNLGESMNRERKRAPVNSAAAKRDWYRIRNAAEDDDGPAEILIYDEIGYGWWGGVSAQDFAKDLGAITADEITVRLNSPGGDVFDGIAILNALRSHKATITVYVDGLAASAASFIAMAGDEIVMRRNSEMMIHDASSYGAGNAGDLRKRADDLDRVSNNIASIYAERTGGTTEEWRDFMLAETWYSAQEAVDAGLANRVDAKVETEEDDKAAAKNSFDLSIFNYAGRHEAPAPPQIIRHADRAGSRPSASRRAPTTPAAKSVGSTRKGGSTVALTLTDEQETSVLEALGLEDGATADEVVTAVEELATAPEESESESENAAAGTTTARLPKGVVAVDAATLADLRRDAEAGVRARAQQLRDADEALVSNAIREGKFGPARRNDWLKALETDRDGATKDINSLAKGLVPVTEIGHGQNESDVTANIEEDDKFKSWMEA